MLILKKCPTPWCNSDRVITTTFYKKGRVRENGEAARIVEVEHSCPVCRVRTPQRPVDQANALWGMCVYD